MGPRYHPVRVNARRGALRSLFAPGNFAWRVTACGTKRECNLAEHDATRLVVTLAVKTLRRRDKCAPSERSVEVGI